MGQEPWVSWSPLCSDGGLQGSVPTRQLTAASHGRRVWGPPGQLPVCLGQHPGPGLPLGVCEAPASLSPASWAGVRSCSGGDFVAASP